MYPVITAVLADKDKGRRPAKCSSTGSRAAQATSHAMAALYNAVHWQALECIGVFLNYPLNRSSWPATMARSRSRACRPQSGALPVVDEFVRHGR
jgi:hypothetical protein